MKTQPPVPLRRYAIAYRGRNGDQLGALLVGLQSVSDVATLSPR